MSKQRCHFHAGKGGVGKSTSSTLSALHLARSGRTVQLVSLDPAHNQADIFDLELGAKPREVAPNLWVAQADIDAWMAEYLKGIENQMRRAYTYQTAFNLEKHLSVIKHSPGIEEYALLLAFRHYREKGRDKDVLVFDMPPTALTTKFFHLPALSLLWVEQLLNLRNEILRKKEIITKIHVGKTEMERDKITCRLNEQQSLFGGLSELFKDPEQSSIHLVVNPDKLSFAEAERMEIMLKEMGVTLGGVIMNKVAPDSQWNEQGVLFANNTVHPLPLSPTPLIGLEALTQYLDTNLGCLDFMVEK